MGELHDSFGVERGWTLSNSAALAPTHDLRYNEAIVEDDRANIVGLYRALCVVDQLTAVFDQYVSTCGGAHALPGLELEIFPQHIFQSIWLGAARSLPSMTGLFWTAAVKLLHSAASFYLDAFHFRTLTLPLALRNKSVTPCRTLAHVAEDVDQI